jgi:CDP-4-dehydro-6-deoxyglucose reductase
VFNITLKNGTKFQCDSHTTIFESAKSNGIILDHSCLSARCRSCIMQIEKGSVTDRLDDLVLSVEEKSNNWILSCNAMPNSDLILNGEELGDIKFYDRKIIPAKIQSITSLNDRVIQVALRLPPNSNFTYNSGQYVNIIKGDIKRSYSIANAFEENGLLGFFIKKHEEGVMSHYWFEEVRVNDLIRIEGPIGSFFLRKTEVENIIFMATGTGIAPIKAMLEEIDKSINRNDHKCSYWIFIGARFEEDFFWKPEEFTNIYNLKYIPVLSRGHDDWKGERGYIQEIVLKQNISLSSSQVYACGSKEMIESAKKLLIENGLRENQFFADVFVATN